LQDRDVVLPAGRPCASSPSYFGKNNREEKGKAFFGVKYDTIPN
jgi:hypothetical protein